MTKKILKYIKPEKLGPLHQKSIEAELSLSDWPPAGQVTYGLAEDVITNDHGLTLTSGSIN